MSTRTKQWAEAWDRMQEQGMPTSAMELREWRKLYGTPHAHELNECLHALYLCNLPMQAIERIGHAVVAAFKMGKDFDGRNE